ncbi:MAG: InlB B-repeat-containing protein [Bacillota bacterium]|jgi:hypothetical protein
MKKLLAVILCLSLLLLLFPMNAIAAGPYDINVLAGDGGRIALTEDGPSENGDISVDEGNDITLYIIPESHYSIDDVMVDGFSEGAISQYTFNDVTSAHSISASFVRNTRTITVAAVENGEILINGSGENGTTVTVDQGSEADVAIRPSTGYEIDSITIGATTYSTDGEIGDRSGEFCRTVTVNDNISVSAEFRLAPHTITTNVGPNGTLSPMNPQVSHGGDVTFTITPNLGYSIRSLSVDGNPESVDEHNQITLYNVQNDRMLSVDFAEDITYTITTIAGPNGSVTPENPEVAAGSDVTFTITPDSGYIIDELRVDGRPEMANEHNEFTVFNVQQDMTLEVTFMQVVAHTITIPKPAHGNIQIVGADGVVPQEGTVITSNTGETVSYFIIPERGYGIADINLRDLFEEETIAFDYYYDEVAQKIRLDVQTMFDYSLHIELKSASAVEHYAILNTETDTEEHIKAAARREWALAGFDVPVEVMTITEISEHTSDNGIDYKMIGIIYPVSTNINKSAVFISVEHYTDIVILCGGFLPEYSLFKNFTLIYTVEPNAMHAGIEIPAISQGHLYMCAPYGAYVAGLVNIDIPSAVSIWVVRPGSLFQSAINKFFYHMQLHMVNRGEKVGKGVNLLPLTIIQENALCINVQGDSEFGRQESLGWDLVTYSNLTLDDKTHEVFFGNDRVIIEKPAGGIGGILSMRAAASNNPGYTFTNNSDGTITIDFLSDYYDKVTVPLTIVKQSGGTVQRNLIIHRVGVDIQAHNAADGNPSPTRTVFHGTQYGNLVDFADGNRYKLTASYFIPDYGDERPYGLYVTRKYANGRIETQIITQPMTNPHPGQADGFDFAKKIYRYNDGSSGWANVADYLIYAGPNAASAPVEVSVLVLKNAPTIGGLFGGVDYGSGTGVTWTKP